MNVVGKYYIVAKQKSETKIGRCRAKFVFYSRKLSMFTLFQLRISPVFDATTNFTLVILYNVKLTQTKRKY